MTSDDNADRVDLEFLTGQRVQRAIQTALAAMPEVDKAERMARCEHSGHLGVIVYRLDDGLVLEWGGLPLAFLPSDLLTEESLLFGDMEGDGREV